MAIELLSRTPASSAATGDGFSGCPAMSLRGEAANFSSRVSDFAADDNNRGYDLFRSRPNAIFSEGFEEGDYNDW